MRMVMQTLLRMFLFAAVGWSCTWIGGLYARSVIMAGRLKESTRTEAPELPAYRAAVRDWPTAFACPDGGNGSQAGGTLARGDGEANGCVREISLDDVVQQRLFTANPVPAAPANQMETRQ